MSLLTICQDACRHLSLPVVSVVVGADTGHAPLLFVCAKQELRDLANRYQWQQLTREHTFTTTATAVQLTASAFPTDFDRIINETMYNRTQRERIWGPLSADEWQHIQANVTTLVDPSYRFRGGTILLSPTPAAGETIAYEYISDFKALSSGGTEQANYAADDDVQISFWPDNVIMLGVIWRYRRAKGYVYSADLEEYERRVVDLIQRDGTKQRLTSDAPTRIRNPWPPRTPDTLVF